MSRTIRISFARFSDFVTVRNADCPQLVRNRVPTLLSWSTVSFVCRKWGELRDDRWSRYKKLRQTMDHRWIFCRENDPPFSFSVSFFSLSLLLLIRLPCVNAARSTPHDRPVTATGEPARHWRPRREFHSRSTS